MHIDVIVERHHRRFDLNVAPINGFKHALKMWQTGFKNCLSASTMTDDCGWFCQPVSVGVIAMMMCVDHGSYRA